MCSGTQVFFVEPTNVCDLRCELCPTNREMQRPKGYMTLFTFRSIVDYIASTHCDDTCFINLWGWGEPLLHNDIFEMITYASNKNIKTRVSTNLNSVTDTQIERICCSELDSIIIGIDGIHQKSHEVYRVGSSIDQVKRNMEKLVSCRKGRGKDRPYVVVTTLITSFSECEVPEIIQYCKGSAVDALILKYPNLWRGKKSIAVVQDNYDKFIKGVTAGSRYSRETSGHITSTDGNCPFVKMNGVFLYDGRLTVCCFDYDGENSLGEISDKHSVRELYSGPVWDNAKVRMSQKDYSTCSTCDSCGPRKEIVLFRKDGNDAFLAGL